MRYAVACRDDQLVPPFVCSLVEELDRRGHERVRADAHGRRAARLLLHATEVEAPRSHYVRTDPSVYVATVLESPTGDVFVDREGLRSASYAALVKTLSNVVVHRVHGGELGRAAWIVTPELGLVPYGRPGRLASDVVRHLLPLAGARMVIGNRLEPDLSPGDLEPDQAARALMAFGRRLDRMNLLPSVFDLSGILDEQARRTLRMVFGIRQLSYGNLSARRDASSFWMSARGSNKGALRRIGADVLLVKGFDRETGEMVLSVPPGADGGVRVSVDAIEHHRIYDAFPRVGAIVHVHAWMDGVEATSQGWPCGTAELADEVLEILRRQPDPERAVIGLRNHGVTITGPDFDDIGRRIEGRLRQNVPVMETA